MASFGKPSRRGSLVRISQVLLGVFVLTTCGQDSATGPGRQVDGFIDATALLRAGGQVPIPVTEVFVELRRTSDNSVAFSRLLTGSEISQTATTLEVRIRVDLHQSPEDFNLLLQALENFRYDQLRLTIDGRTDAEMDVGLHIKGANPDLYDGHPIELNLNLEGALANVLRSGLAGYQIPERIRERMQGFGR